MTDKEKAKAYDKAIERAKKLYGNGITEEIFHELKELKINRKIFGHMTNLVYVWQSNMLITLCYFNHKL